MISEDAIIKIGGTEIFLSPEVINLIKIMLEQPLYKLKSDES